MPTPSPPANSRFKPGQSGNPGGKTREQRQAEIRNAQLATELRGQLLDALHTVLEDAKGNPAVILEQLDANTLRLIKDAEDRGLGAPKTSVDLSSPDGSLGREAVCELANQVLDAIHGKPAASLKAG